MVSIVGRPNVGKSTLLNQILGEKVTIVSKTPQTTRHRIRGIHNDNRGQIIFIDTPGLVMGRDKLDDYLKKASLGTIYDVDVLIHLVDSNLPVGEMEEVLVERLTKTKVPIILGLNKIDKRGKCADQYIQLWERIADKSVADFENFTILPISSTEDTNVRKLIDILFEHIPEGPALYPEDIIVDFPKKLAIADIIREKLLRILRDEIPHSIAVIVETIEPRKGKVTHISAHILVEKESHKEIVIGKGGAVLKKVGTYAREDLEYLLDTQVYLETHVKLRKHWRDNLGILQQLGYEPD